MSSSLKIFSCCQIIDFHSLLIAVFTSSTDAFVLDARVMAAHYVKLRAKMGESKPNQKVVGQLLALEYPARRAYITALNTTSQKKIELVVRCFWKADHVSLKRKSN